VLTAASVVALALAVIDRHPMWPVDVVNMAEAAATRNDGEVVRLIESGEDFNRRYPVRAGLLFDRPAFLTPLEAAVASDDPMLVQRLIQEGMPIDVERWTYLHCIAGGDEAPRVIDQYRPPNTEPDCDRVRAPWPQDD
jgi:hypothetical protein